MLKNVKILNKTEASKVLLFINGDTKPLTAEALTDEEARLIAVQYPDSYGLYFEDKKKPAATTLEASNN
ncbi:hypothetical protein [Siphonobacter sp. SORGH_AS_0500]|uniref:hypothetical protein n=1 Tax=Siphonobacter sp. SORGH_AS_0500 TaxID=1864824 RepID=UPI002859C987|nr:hypothetical protein [Siphonobacter sp. SORGH_AS_0500]MDR6195913.1 hypothetical protein [Siphonobacter sp. SORGH_AS_0500]